MTQTGVVYSREIEGKTFTFGVSGRLYKSNVLLYDHQTESLWSQLMEKAIAGPMAGKGLKKLDAKRTSWKTWQRLHPDTLVLSTETGYSRNYGLDPYEGYYRAAGIWFPVGDVRKDLSPKEMVLGIALPGGARAYALSILKNRPGILKDRVEGVAVRISINGAGQVTEVKDAQGEPLPHLFAYWFAWQAFHPETSVYRED